MHCTNYQQTIVEKTLSIIEDIISQQVGWENMIFPFIPEIRGSKLIMNNMPAWKKIILESESPFIMALHAAYEHRCVVNIGRRSIALINIQMFIEMKEELRKKFQLEMRDFDRVFALGYLFQTIAMIEISTERQSDVEQMDSEMYIAAARLAMNKYLSRYGKDTYHAIMVDYFYYSFTNDFAEIHHFFSWRNKMLNAIAHEVGGYND